MPQSGSVLTPEKEYEAYHKTAEKTRDLLFMGAIMHLAEEVHSSGELSAFVNPNAASDARQCAEAIMKLLHLAVDNKWNVAYEMLKWRKQRVVNKIQERISDSGVLPSVPTDNTAIQPI